MTKESSPPTEAKMKNIAEGGAGTALGGAEPLLHVEDLHVEVEGREIVKGLTLSLAKGEIHALMGPNGSGKSTLAYVLTGRPGYQVTAGKVLYKGEDVLALAPDERAQRGIFLAFQYPTEVPGVSVVNFLRTAYNATHPDDQKSAMAFRMYLQEKLDELEIPSELVDRYVNQGFSGGEKKRNEILQMAALRPELAILDETDSGLDIDALKHVSAGINKLASPDVGILLITHYQRLLNYIRPQYVHVLLGGRIVDSGGPELAERLEAEGYAGLAKELGLPVEAIAEVEGKEESKVGDEDVA
jgi:Fe-S cluster assembly ATP-binding protein